MKILLIPFFLWVASYSVGGSAAVVPLQIKTIFHANITEQRVTVVNRNDEGPVILESWVDDGVSGKAPDSAEYPFVVIPPVIKMDKMEVKNLRVIITDKITSLPRDKESLFFLNLYEVPGVKRGPALESELRRIKIGLNSQLKIIYRPVADPQSWQEILKKVNFTLIKNNSSGYSLQIHNPSPYYLTPLNISLSAGSTETHLTMPFDRDINPYADRVFPISQWAGSVPTRIQISISDDQGQAIQFEKAWVSRP